MQAICRSVRQYSPMTSQRTELSAVMAQLLNPNHVSFISSEAKLKVPPILDVSEKDSEKFQNLMLPYIYVRQVPRKHVLDLVINGFNHWIKLPKDKVITFQEIYSDMYEYGILVDDTLDDTAARRTHPTAHRIYGLKRTLLSSNAVLLRITEKLREFDNPMITRWFDVTMLHFAMAQNEELCWVNDSKCPTMSQYYDLIRIKLEYYFGFIIQAMQSMSEYKQDLSTILKIYCKYYEIQNDHYINWNEQYWKSKSFGDDISAGRYTLPTIHAVNSGTMEGEIVLNIIRQRTKDNDLIKYCLFLLEKIGSLEYVKQLHSETQQQFRAEIDRLGGNVILEKMIDKMYLWQCDEKFTDDE